MMRIIAKIKEFKIIKLEGKTVLMKVPSLPHRISSHEQIRPCSEIGMGTFFNSLAGKRFQVQ